MENKVNNWSFQTQTEEGLYLVCLGDVESPQNISLAYFTSSAGELFDEDGACVEDYNNRCKFAKLSFN